MSKGLIVLFIVVLMISSFTHAQSLQTVLNDLNYTVNVTSDEIPGDLYFQVQSSNASIIFQESSQYPIEAFGWYSENEEGEWLIGGFETGFPIYAELPIIDGNFGFKMNPNYTGTGFLTGVWYSEPSLNVGGADNLKVFHTQVNGEIIPNSYLLCWEDWGAGYGDYQDMIVRVDGVQALDENNNPVPTPPTYPNFSVANLQNAINVIGYTIDVTVDGIGQDVFFQVIQDNAQIVFQESSQLYIEAFGWYSENEEGDWLIGGLETGFPMSAQLPNLQGIFGFKLHPNYTGTGFISGIWYSQPSLNYDGLDHVAIFPTSINNQIIENSYILCWEDLEGGGASDYQDMIVRVDGVQAFESNGSPVQPTTLQKIDGFVNSPNSALGGVELVLYDEDGITYDVRYTNEIGYYNFENIPSGEYTLELVVPLGFIPDDDPNYVFTLLNEDISKNFSVAELETDDVKHIWWWKVYLANLIEHGPRVDQFTVEDVHGWCNIIFDHYYERSDDNAIIIAGATYTGYPARALTLGDIVYTLVYSHDETFEAYTRKHLLVNLLNIASGKVSQNKIISSDGATLSQAVTYFAQVYMDNKLESTIVERNNLIEASLALRDIEMGVLLGAGKIPPITPNIMYKVVENNPLSVPNTFSLSQNYPNPFNPNTTFSFSLPKEQSVILDIYNILGQRVEQIVNRKYTAGHHTIEWDGNEFASGIYLYKIETDEYSSTKKMVLMK